jgi:3-oxoacyl-[acyl-carrier-protein] synthase II
MVGIGYSSSNHKVNKEMKKRVVVTGIGCVTPIGNSYEEVKKSLFEGRSGIKYYEEDKANMGWVDFDIDSHIAPLDQTVTDRISRFAWYSYLKCKEDAKITKDHVDGIFFGVAFAGCYTIDNTFPEHLKNRRTRPNTLVNICPNSPACFIALKENIQGPNFTYNTACSSSALAIGEAYERIARGDCKGMIVGGSESSVTPYHVTCWHGMRALSMKDEGPKACRPFSKDRSGVVIAEGCSVFFLEEYEQAKSRGAKIYCEILGYGTSWGSESMTKPSVEGEQRAIQIAVEKIQNRKVTFISAHATATQTGDIVELQAIKNVFGDEVKDIPITSTKALHGHTLGASGIIEAMGCIAVLQEDKVIPNWHLGEQDNDVPENIYLPKEVVDKKQDVCLNNSFGFGGSNVVLIMGKYNESLS